jgi:hypothetical protein
VGIELGGAWPTELGAKELTEGADVGAEPEGSVDVGAKELEVSPGTEDGALGVSGGV